jgi:hypothetical protein
MPQYYDASLNDEYGDEAQTPLFRGRVDEDSSYDELPSRSPQADRRELSGTMINRLLVILTLVVLVFVSNHFQSTQLKLTQQIGHDEDTIQKLQQTIQQQGVVINRFNASVTNKDVVKRLTSLEYNLESSVKDLRDDIDKTVRDVDIKLNKTMIALEESVADAEREITNSVKEVKKEYEEFERATSDQFSMENSFMIWQLAGTFTLLSCLISTWHMSAHFRKFNQPQVQRKILAILWMSPIYAVTSWFSLVFPDTEGYLAIIKDSYEAYVIYQVNQFMCVPHFIMFALFSRDTNLKIFLVFIVLYFRTRKGRQRQSH